MENSNWQKFTPDLIVDFKSGDLQVIENFEQFVKTLPDLGLQLVLFDLHEFFLSFQYWIKGLGFAGFEHFDMLKNLHQFMAPITVILRLEPRLRAPSYLLYETHLASF